MLSSTREQELMLECQHCEHRSLNTSEFSDDGTMCRPCEQSFAMLNAFEQEQLYKPLPA